jgi:hypothetical protein
MSLTITRILQVDQNEWFSVWKNCEWSTFYESIDWFNVWDQFVTAETSYDAIKYDFSDGVSCIVPRFSRKIVRGFQNLVEMSPGGLYGGPISEQQLTTQHLAVLLDRLSADYPNLEFRENPFICLNQTSSGKITSDFTQSLNLMMEADQAKESFNRHKVAYDARLAEKNGLHVIPIGLDYIDAFCEIYNQAKSRWKKSTSSYDLNFFTALIKSNYSDFWGIFDKDNGFIGGGIMVKGTQSVSSWLAIMDENKLKLRPYELYYHYLFWHYKSNGYHWLDLNPSGGHKGVVDFKSKFIPTNLRINSLSQRSNLVTVSDAFNNLVR